MKLTLIMYAYYLLFRVTAWKKEPFRQRLEERDLILVMRARDREVARSFIFEQGRVRSTAGDRKDAQCRLVWVSASDGARVMMEIARGGSKALMKAVIDGRLLLEGDAMAVSWYMGAVNLLGKMYLKKKNKKG